MGNMVSVAAPRASQGVPRNTLTWKKNWKKKIFTNFFILALYYRNTLKLKKKNLIVLLSSKKNKWRKPKINFGNRGKPTETRPQQITEANPRILKKKKKKTQYRAAEQIKSELTSNFLNQKSLKA